MLQFLKANGCPWDRDSCLEAIENSLVVKEHHRAMRAWIAFDLRD